MGTKWLLTECLLSALSRTPERSCDLLQRFACKRDRDGRLFEKYNYFAMRNDDDASITFCHAPEIELREPIYSIYFMFFYVSIHRALISLLVIYIQLMYKRKKEEGEKNCYTQRRQRDIERSRDSYFLWNKDNLSRATTWIYFSWRRPRPTLANSFSSWKLLDAEISSPRRIARSLRAVDCVG